MTDYNKLIAGAEAQGVLDDLEADLLAALKAVMAERDDVLHREAATTHRYDAKLDAAEAEAAALRARVAELEGALVEHNDLLRSAFEIAKREGVNGEIASTNWDAYYNRVTVVLKRHHRTTNDARAALRAKAKEAGE